MSEPASDEQRKYLITHWLEDRLREIEEPLNFSTVLKHLSFEVQPHHTTELVVSAPSDLSMSIHVASDRAVRLILDGGITNFRAEFVRGGKPSANWVRDDALDALFEDLDSTIHGAESERLRTTRAPIICAKPWADGPKVRFSNLTATAAASIARRTILVGAPGSGKSTIARWIAAAHLGVLLGKRLPTLLNQVGYWPGGPQTILFFEWGDFSRSKYWPRDSVNVYTADLLKYLLCNTPNSDVIEPFLIDQLRKGRATIIGDGVDEMSLTEPKLPSLEEQSLRARKLLDDIASNYPSAHAIMTLRPSGLSPDTFDNCLVASLPGLSANDQSNLISAFFSRIYTNAERASEETQGFIRNAERVDDELRSQPLFLTLLVLLYTEQGQYLPARRSELLEAFLSLLLGSWSQRRFHGKTMQDILGCGSKEILSRLGALALRVTEKRGPDQAQNREFALGDVLEELSELTRGADIVEVLDYITVHAGILSSPAPRTFKFTHRTFEEYLCAKHIVETDKEFLVVQEQLRKSANSWVEIVRFLSDILLSRDGEIKVWALVDLLVESADGDPLPFGWMGLWQAANIIEDHKLRGGNHRFSRAAASVMQGLISSVLDADGPPDPRYRFDLARTLGRLGDTRRGTGVSNTSLPDIAWCPISAGSFLCGSDERDLVELEVDNLGTRWNFAREQPKFSYYLDKFEIARFPVTVAQYQAFITAKNGFSFDKWWNKAGITWRDSSHPAKAAFDTPLNCPQTGVTWYEAIAFCRWLSECLAEEISLPTEVEWEKAARGSDGRLFPWGNSKEISAANTVGAGLGYQCPVGTFADNNSYWGQSGPRDLIGNTWEWCTSIVEFENGSRTFEYPYQISDGREDMLAGDEALRATRGGYHQNDFRLARCSYRGRDIPSARFDRQGFRIIRRRGKSMSG